MVQFFDSHFNARSFLSFVVTHCILAVQCSYYSDDLIIGDIVNVCVYSMVDASVTPPQFATRLEPVTVISGENTKLSAVITGDCQTYHGCLIISVTCHTAPSLSGTILTVLLLLNFGNSRNTKCSTHECSIMLT